ncbi:hypothetical protein ACTFIZ_009443 [Dictyostelium cf. discoideum]
MADKRIKRFIPNVFPIEKNNIFKQLYNQNLISDIDNNNVILNSNNLNSNNLNSNSLNSNNLNDKKVILNCNNLNSNNDNNNLNKYPINNNKIKTGFKNNGSDCFIYSILFIFSLLEPYRDYFINQDLKSGINKNLRSFQPPRGEASSAITNQNVLTGIQCSRADKDIVVDDNNNSTTINKDIINQCNLNQQEKLIISLRDNAKQRGIRSCVKTAYTEYSAQFQKDSKVVDLTFSQIDSMIKRTDNKIRQFKAKTPNLPTSEDKKEIRKEIRSNNNNRINIHEQSDFYIKLKRINNDISDSKTNSLLLNLLYTEKEFQKGIQVCCFEVFESLLGSLHNATKKEVINSIDSNHLTGTKTSSLKLTDISQKSISIKVSHNNDKETGFNNFISSTKLISIPHPVSICIYDDHLIPINKIALYFNMEQSIKFLMNKMEIDKHIQRLIDIEICPLFIPPIDELYLQDDFTKMGYYGQLRKQLLMVQLPNFTEPMYYIKEDFLKSKKR